jgi:hypothetical protein
MVPIDVEALRAQVQAMDYLRGTPDEVELWREEFAMMLDEGLPPALMPSIILTLYWQDTTAPERAGPAP